MTNAKTLFDRVWEDHVVIEEPGNPTVLYIDLHMIHEVTSPQAFQGLRERGLKVRRPDLTVATGCGQLKSGAPARGECRTRCQPPRSTGRLSRARSRLSA